MQEINRACAAVSRTAGWASSCLHLKGGAANEDIKSKKISGKRTHDDASLDECPDSHSETEGDEGTDTDTYTDTDSSSFSETQDVTNEDAHAARGEESEESASRGDEDRSDSESTESDTSAGDEPLKDESSAGLQQCPAGQRCYSGAGCAFKLLKEVKLQQEPWAVAVGPKDKLLYVSLALKHKILVIDPESGAVLRAFHSRGIPTYEPGELRQEQDRMHATQGLSLGSGANLTQDGQHEKHGGRAPVEWDERKEALLHSPPAIDFELRKAHGGRRDGKQDKGLPYKLWVPCGIAFNPQGDLLVADRCVCVCVCVCILYVCQEVAMASIAYAYASIAYAYACATGWSSIPSEVRIAPLAAEIRACSACPPTGPSSKRSSSPASKDKGGRGPAPRRRRLQVWV